MKHHLSDDDYVLAEGAAWLETGKFAIRIHTTDEGVVVDIYPNGTEKVEAAVASCYAFNDEV